MKMIDRHRDQISGTAKRTSERRISAPSLEKISGGTTASQAVLATLQHCARCSTIISPSTITETTVKVEMKRSIALQRQVSPSLFPNRTCKFPSIRLSMHGRSRAYGWVSDMSETLKRIPEAAHAFALLVLSVCGPSVRLRNTLTRVMHRSSVTEKPQAFGPFGPLPSLSR